MGGSKRFPPHGFARWGGTLLPPISDGGEFWGVPPHFDPFFAKNEGGMGCPPLKIFACGAKSAPPQNFGIDYSVPPQNFGGSPPPGLEIVGGDVPPQASKSWGGISQSPPRMGGECKLSVYG